MWENIVDILFNEHRSSYKLPWISNLIGYIADGLNQITSNIVAGLSRILSGIFLDTPIFVYYSPSFQNLYRTMKMFVTLFLVPVIAWLFFLCIIHKADWEDTLKSIGRLLLARIIMEFILPFIVTMLTLVNKIVRSLLGGYLSASNFNYNTDISMLIFILVYLFFLYRLIIYYCYRNYSLIAECINFPFIAILWASGKENALNMWFKNIVKLVVIQFAHAIQLVIMSIVASDGVTGIFLQIGALIYMFKTPSWLEDYIDAVPNVYQESKKVARSAKRFSSNTKNTYSKSKDILKKAKDTFKKAFK